MNEAYIQLDGSGLTNQFNGNAPSQYQPVGRLVPISLNVQGKQNVSFTAPNTITIEQDGNYLLNVVGQVSHSAGSGTYVYGLMLNNHQPNSIIPLATATLANENDSVTFQTTRMYRLAAGNTVKFAIGRTSGPLSVISTTYLDQFYLVKQYSDL